MTAQTLTVRMRYQISGARWDGQPWPPPGGIISVPEWEFADLIRAGHADPDSRTDRDAWAALDTGPPPGLPSKTDPHPGRAAPPRAQGTGETEPAAKPAEVAAVAAQGRTGDDGTDGSAAGAAEPPAAAAVPGPAAPKQDWISYAVTQGADPDMAAKMTKADLMSRYGGRL